MGAGGGGEERRAHENSGVDFVSSVDYCNNGNEAVFRFFFFSIIRTRPCFVLGGLPYFWWGAIIGNETADDIINIIFLKWET